MHILTHPMELDMLTWIDWKNKRIKWHVLIEGGLVLFLNVADAFAKEYLVISPQFYT